MSIREKTAIISTGLNLALTVLKFVTYFFTGSIAILADAWHSFIDIITSLLVYISVRKKQKEKESSPPPPPPPGIKGIKKVIYNISNMSLEYKISFIIGLFIIIVSFSLIKEVIVPTVEKITNPLTAGIIFIIFSFGSYIVFKFETGVGKKEKSAALVSDGMHSKADMVTAFLTGLSLIIYKMGWDIDRWVALIISFFVFSFGIETMVNVLVAIVKKREFTILYKSTEIIASLFDKNKWKSLLIYIDREFNINIEKTLPLSKLPYILIAVILILYGSTLTYTVKPYEEAIIERFGKPININHPVQPGLHFKFPFPVDKVIKIKSKIIRYLQVGNIENKNSFALLWTVEHGAESSFLTGDNNFFYPYIIIHYRIKNIFDYHYQYKKPKILLDEVAHKIITSIFSKNKFYNIITTMRQKLSDNMKEQLQDNLDKLKCGIEVITVNFKDMHPPISIGDVFEDVIASMQDRERYINEAYGYKNSSIPEAKGESVRTKNKAEAYVNNKILHSEGESKRFLMRLNGLTKNKQISEKRIFLDTIKSALKKNNKIIVDPSSGVPEIWINFPKNLSAQGE